MIYLFHLLSFLVILGILAILFFISKNKIHSRPQIIYLIFTIVALIWVIVNSLLRISQNHEITLFLLKAAYAVGLLSVFSMTLLCFEFPKQIKIGKINLLYMYIILFIPVLFFSLAAFTDYIVTDYANTGIVMYPQYNNDGFNMYSSLVTLLLILAVIVSSLQYKFSSGLFKKQARLVFLGVIISFAYIITVSAIIPSVFNSSVLANFDYFSMAIFIALSFYAIFTYHLFDIKLIIKKSIIYSVLLIAILSAYCIIILIFSQILHIGNQDYLENMLPNIIAAICIAAGFEPLKKWLTEKTDKYLFKGEYDSRVVLNYVSKVLASATNLDETLFSINSVLKKEMRLEDVEAYTIVIDPETGQEILKCFKKEKCEQKILFKAQKIFFTYFEKCLEYQKTLTKTNGLPQEMKLNIKPFIADYPYDSDCGLEKSYIEQINNEVKEINKEILLPIVVGKKVIGLFIIGHKKSGDIFSQEDLELLTIVANETAAAIEKARFYEDDKLKTELVSIASHELLTPTAAIEGYLSMILDEGVGKVDAKARKYLQNVYISSQRLAKLVIDLLNVSRIEQGRIKLEMASTNTNEVVNNVVEELMPKIKEKKLKLNYSKSAAKKANLYTDQSKLHQILVNLIGNAIKYTQKGSITIKILNDDKFVKISIADTGIGIPADEIPHLFKKFYKSSNAKLSGAQGTGLGLFISKNIIQQMGGDITVKSILGKGSTFTLSLPIKRGQSPR